MRVARAENRKCALTLRRCCSHRLRRPWLPPPCRSFLENKKGDRAEYREDASHTHCKHTTEARFRSTFWIASLGQLIVQNLENFQKL